MNCIVKFWAERKVKKNKTYGIRISHENTVKRHPALQADTLTRQFSAQAPSGYQSDAKWATLAKVWLLIFLKTGGTDEAICYAETASSPEDRKFANHLININGEEVLNKRKVYERSRANAWNNEDSILKLATAIMKENAELKKKFGIDAIEVGFTMYLLHIL